MPIHSSQDDKKESDLVISPFGFLIIDKPAGITSHDCVNTIRKIFNIKKVGHGGTLDPAVTGVLPIAIGNATRLLPYLPKEKIYQAIIQLGIQTSTDDLEGEITSQTNWPLIQEIDFEKHLQKFRGTILQKPPQFSSIHVAGERAYQKARRGEKFNLAAREITIHKLDLLKWDIEKGLLTINVHCSPGTYIRSLARDLGQSLQCGGCLANLNRTQSQGFYKSQSITLERVKELSLEDKISLLNPSEVLAHLPKKILLDKEEVNRWRKGQQLIIKETYDDLIENKENAKDDNSNRFIMVIDHEYEIAGIGEYSTPYRIKPKVVFNAYG